MLELLRIHDLALIEDLEMEFAPGLNVLTGETGAGKSFILRALNFLTGEKLEADMVRPGKAKAVVEALFVLDGEDRILRRELSADSGRSRLYLNDRLCSQEVVREMRSSLLLHTSQHEQQKLLQPSWQSGILDDYLQQPELLEEKTRLQRALADNQAKAEELDRVCRSLEEKRDLLEYQEQEIEKVAPLPGEEEELEVRRALFRNRAGIDQHIAAALQALHGEERGSGILSLLNGLERAMGGLGQLSESYADASELLTDIRLSLQDLDARLLKTQQSGMDEAELEAVEARLFALVQLQRKLKRPLSAIVSLREELRENLDFLDSSVFEKKQLTAEAGELADALAALLRKLNPLKEEKALAFSHALQEELKQLGFSEHVRVFFQFMPHPASMHAACREREDCRELRGRLLWQPNPGQPAQPLDRIASGGELSRFLLAVTTILSRTTNETPTLIFDEVDSGVGGLTLGRVTDSLDNLAASRQLLIITHWPQLAARAHRHFVVNKDVQGGQTFTRCQRLEGGAVQRELARMAGEETPNAAEPSRNGKKTAAILSRPLKSI